MNATLLSTIVLALGLAANAQPAPDQKTLSALGPSPWDVSSSHWDRILSGESTVREFQLGKSDFIVSGPLMDGFRQERLSSDVSVGRKFLGLPIVRLLVPQRMPAPPGGTGKYFAWRDNSRSWASVSAASPPGYAFSTAYVEPSGALISFRRSD